MRNALYQSPNASSKIQLQHMNEDELDVQVVDRRMQVNLDDEEGVPSSSPNEFMPEQGFEVRQEEEEEQEDQEPHYKLQKLLPRQNQKQRLIQQNIKLKTQIYELAKQLDEILLKDKSKKKTYGIGINRGEEEDERVREKRLEVQKQQMELADLKHKIFIAKRQLECVYNNDTIQLKEDENKTLKGELKTEEEEKSGHLNIQKLQNKELKIMRNEEEYGDKIKNVGSECGRLRKEAKILLEKIYLSEKVLMKAHDAHVGKRENLREIEQKLTLNKEKEKGRGKKQNDTLITEQMIETMETEIKKLQIERKEGEKTWQDKIKSADVELIIKRGEEEKRLIILRDKERELKINQLRIKQLRKLVRQKEDGGLEGRRTSQNMDMSQFRHKRNIIRFEK